MNDPRVHALNDLLPRVGGKFVLYWMQQSQRTRWNHALELAIARGSELGLPVVVGFGLMGNYPEATERHYAFMIQGLADVKNALEKRGILFVVRHGVPVDVALGLAKDAAMVVCDRAYLRHLRRWRDQLADEAGCAVIEVESDVVVPVDVASNKAEFAARTIRPKIHKQWKAFLVPMMPAKPKHSSVDLKIKSDFDLSDPAKVLAKIDCDRGVKPSRQLIGGEVAAQKLLGDFVAKRLSNYDEGRNQPVAGHTSLMSPYLQYGQISPVDIALRVMESKNGSPADRDSYLEELIVRRELSHNLCNFCPNYDAFDCIPDWAKKTLEKHAGDERPTVYTRGQLEKAETHDVYWNAAQLEMVHTGFMHNYMRMYWGKKILEWSKTPKAAYETTVYLNNRYLLDGLNANTYGNIGWIYGLHDRPWTERPIFGTVRYMNAGGLERKFDIDAYVRKIAMLSR